MASASDPPIRRLFPEPGMTTATEAAAIAPPEDGAPADRPWVVVNMVSSADGRSAIGGASGGLGSPTDRRMFAALRTHTDCVLVGTGTLAAERYGSIIREPTAREARVRAGLAPHALACVVSRSGQVPLDIPLFQDPEQPVDVYTSGATPTGPLPGDVNVIRMPGAELTLAAVLRDLRARHGLETVLCEGGPRIVGALLAEDCVDELFLTFSPLLVGGGAGATIAEGPPAPAPVPLRLVHVLEDEGLLFLRYAVRR